MTFLKLSINNATTPVLMSMSEDKNAVTKEEKTHSDVRVAVKRCGCWSVVLMDAGTPILCLWNQCGHSRSSCWPPWTHQAHCPKQLPLSNLTYRKPKRKYFPPSPGRLFLLEATSSLRSIKESGKKTPGKTRSQK